MTSTVWEPVSQVASGEGGGALGGVYKLVRFDGRPKLKVSNDISKSTLPDYKRLFRVIGSNGIFLMDIICLEDEQIKSGDIVYDPANPARHKAIPEDVSFQDVRNVVMEDGKVCIPSPTLDEMADRSAEQLKLLPEGSLRLENPHIYKVSISYGLHNLRMRLIEEVHRGFGKHDPLTIE